MSNDKSENIELGLAADQQRRLAEIGRIVTASIDLNTVFSEFAKLANNLVPFDRLAISTVDPETQLISDALITGLETSELNYAGPYTLEDSALPAVVYENHQVSIADASALALIADTDVVADSSVRIEAGLRSAMFTPIVLQGKLVGSLVFRSKQKNPYGDPEAVLAAQIAAQIAGVISTNQQISLLERASKHNQQLVFEQSRISEIGRIVSSTFEFDEVLSRFAQQAKQLVPHDRLVISSWSEDGKILVDQHVAGIEIPGHEVGHELEVAQDHIWRRLYKEKLPWVVNGDDYLEQTKRNDRERTRFTSGLRSLMIVPLLWQGKNSGSMAFRSKNPESFGEHEIELAIEIAAQISGAIAAATQYKQLEQQSEERERLAFEQTLIAEIGRLTGSTFDLEEVFDTFVDRAKQLIPLDRMVISIIDPNGDSAIDAYVFGETVEDAPAGIHYRIDGGFKTIAAQTESFNPSLAELEKMAETSPSEMSRLEAGFRSLLMAPMNAQGNPVGTLIFRSKQLNAYSDRHINLAKQISDQIGGAVAGSHQYQQLQAESAERERLALELAKISEIGRIVSSTLDIEEVLTAFVEQARLLVPFDRIVITVANDDLTEVIDVLVDGVLIDEESTVTSHPFTENTVQEQLIRTQQRIVANGEEYERHARENKAELARFNAGLRSVMMIPLVWQGRSFGSINFRSLDPNAYGDREVELAEQIAAQIAGAIATSNQFRSLEAALDDVRLQAAALEAAEDAIIIRNLDSTVVYVNPEFEKQTGFTTEEVVGKDFDYPEHTEVEEGALDNVWDTVKNGKTWRKTVATIHKDGTEYIVDATLTPIFDRDGQVDKFLGVRRNVTEKVKADELNKTLAAALEWSNEAVMILNPDTSIDWVNEAFVRDTGYSREEAIGQRSPFLRSEKNSSEVFDGLWEQVRTGQTWVGRVWTKRKDGSEYLCDASLSPVFGDDGTITKYVGTRRDITAIIQAEQDREARRDLDAQNKQLLEMNDQREEFFSSVSHELRTPLTSVMAFADILSRDRDNNLTDLQKDHLDVIKRNSRNLNELVEDMLDFSRMSNDHLKLEKSEFEFHSLLDSVIESMEPTAAERGQTLAIEPHTEPVWIVADHGRIIQIVSNLITNSCKYSPTGTRITIKVRSESGQVSVTVSDQGVGIPAKDLASIYSPFFRSDQLEVREEVGTGLGLAISKTLVSLHDGTIEAKSVIDEGTDITVTLPGASSIPTVNARASR